MFEPKGKVIGINGISVPVNPDFRIMCDFGAARLRGDVMAMQNAAKRFFFADIPPDITPSAAVEGMAEFYCSGMMCGKKAKGTGSSLSVPSFDFEEDEAYFYAAFLECYRIDLTTAKLHWFDFCKLFMGLPDECRLRQIMGIRAAKLSDIKYKPERNRIAKLKEAYALECLKKSKPKSVECRDKQIREHLLMLHRKAREKNE